MVWTKFHTVILVLVFMFALTLGGWYRSEQVIRLRDNLMKQQVFINNTKQFLERSKLDAKTAKIFNELGWNLPVPEPQLPANPMPRSK